MGGYMSSQEPHAGEDGYYYGWLKDPPDARDHIYRLSLDKIRKANSVTTVDLRSRCPPVYNQGRLGSCTANAIGGAFQFDLEKQGLPDFVPSRLFIYYNERAMEGTVNWDAGAYIRDGVKSVNRQGTCHESMWPYDTSKYRIQPTRACYSQAQNAKLVKYARVSQKVEDLKAALVYEQVPIVFGFRVHRSFHGWKVRTTGRMPMPGPPNVDPVMGGHAVTIVGFIDAEQVFIIRNSWGTFWGDRGYFYMPYKFIENPRECNDFWLIRYVSERTGGKTAKPVAAPKMSAEEQLAALKAKLEKKPAAPKKTVEEQLAELKAKLEETSIKEEDESKEPDLSEFESELLSQGNSSDDNGFVVLERA